VDEQVVAPESRGLGHIGPQAAHDAGGVNHQIGRGLRDHGPRLRWLAEVEIGAPRQKKLMRRRAGVALQRTADEALSSCNQDPHQLLNRSIPPGSAPPG
jgi:hypothetical protein